MVKNLRATRERAGISQKELAERLGTSQQTVARWESGKAEPKLAVLRDIALQFYTTVDELLGRPSVLEKQSINPISRYRGDDSGFWGHIGLRRPQREKTDWYPVTTKTMREIYADLQRKGDQPESWVVFQTLNNRMIIAKPSALSFVTFLDEADDGVCDEDWDVNPDQIEGESQELYKCLDHILSGDTGDEEFSESLTEYAQKFMHDMKLNEDALIQFLCGTEIAFKDGSTKKMLISERRLANAFFYLDINNGEPFTLMLDDDYGERDVFVPSTQVSIISMPLQHLEDGLQRQREEDGI